MPASSPHLLHPEWVGGRRLWIDPVMQDIIDKMHYGDPTKGWEGDERLAVYYDQPERRWVIQRLEEDGEYRMVCRSGPGVPFDDRLIENLVAWDGRRRQESLHDEVTRINEAIDAKRERDHSEYVREELAPRLRWALEKDGA